MAITTMEQIFDDLVQYGGAIVLSSECHPVEIADAKGGGRFFARADGMGFVRRHPEWLKSRETAYAEREIVPGSVE